MGINNTFFLILKIPPGIIKETICVIGTPAQRRMCVDFRRLNKKLPEVHNMSGGKGCISLVPLPKIDERKTTGIQSFLYTGFEIWILPHRTVRKCQAQNSFCSIWDTKYQLNRVPFGLAQASAYFQRLINEVLTDCKFAMGYLDDIIIFSKNEEEHLQHLEEIFERLRKAGIKTPEM